MLLWFLHITVIFIAPYQHMLTVYITITMIMVYLASISVVPNITMFHNIIIRCIVPYQHILTVCINMTTNKINYLFVVPHTAVVSPNYNNIYCTLPTQTEPLYNSILMWILQITRRFSAHYQHILIACITMTTSRINSVSIVPITDVVCQHNNNIDCSLSTHIYCLCIYDSQQDKLCFFCS